MITGKVMYDVTVSVDNEKQLNDLSTQIQNTVKTLSGVEDCEEVDNELDDDGEEGSDKE